MATTCRGGGRRAGQQRAGHRPVETVLAVFYDTRAGRWRYPPHDGFATDADGRPITCQQTLRRGHRVDRYGGEHGAFLAPRGLSYTERAIPPSGLVGGSAAGRDYHVYRVLRPFDVRAGSIAPWFGQPGGGEQYLLDGVLLPGAPTRLTVKWLLDNGYLGRD